MVKLFKPLKPIVTTSLMKLDEIKQNRETSEDKTLDRKRKIDTNIMVSNDEISVIEDDNQLNSASLLLASASYNSKVFYFTLHLLFVVSII